MLQWLVQEQKNGEMLFTIWKQRKKRFAAVDGELLIFDGIVTCRRSLSLSLNIRYWTQSLRLFSLRFPLLDVCEDKNQFNGLLVAFSFSHKGWCLMSLTIDQMSLKSLASRHPSNDSSSQNIYIASTNLLFNSTRFQRSCKKLCQFFLPSSRIKQKQFYCGTKSEFFYADFLRVALKCSQKSIRFIRRSWMAQMRPNELRLFGYFLQRRSRSRHERKSAVDVRVVHAKP